MFLRLDNGDCFDKNPNEDKEDIFSYLVWYKTQRKDEIFHKNLFWNQNIINEKRYLFDKSDSPAATCSALASC